MKLFLVLALLMSSLTSTYASDQRTCSDLLAERKSELDHDNRFATNDVVLSLVFTLPMVLIFPPAVVFPVTVVGYKVSAMVKLKNAKDAEEIYLEAANNGGKRTKKLLRKIKKSHPESTLTYDQLLEAIREADKNGEGCQGKFPNKKNIMTVIEA